MTPFDAYRLYVAVKLHMTTDDYDLIKYCGKIRSATTRGFEKRNDKWSFVKLAKTYPREEDLILFLASNHLKGSPYIRDLTSNPEYHNVYIEHLKIRESIEYTVEKDLRYLLEKYPQPSEMFSLTDGRWPSIVQEYQHGQVHLETVCVLSAFIPFRPMWQRKITDTILWPGFYRTMTKFTPFVHYDRAVMQKKILSLFKQYSLTNA